MAYANLRPDEQDPTSAPGPVPPAAPTVPDRRKQIIEGIIIPDFKSIAGQDPGEQDINEGYDVYERFGGDAFRAKVRERFPSKGGGGASSSGSVPPFQFDDPSTRQLETIARNQMGEIRSNPGLDALNAFLTKRFAELTEAPGYSQDELALLNTQAFEPIEQLRKAGTKRVIDRTAARGFLPSSGLHELDLRDIDRQADELRTRASRDLAVGAIDRRDQDLATALQLGQLRGLTIPQGQRAEELNLSNLLYNLPRNALNDALAVLSGSPSSSSLGSNAFNLANLDQMNRNNNMQKWAYIAQLLAGMFG